MNRDNSSQNWRLEGDYFEGCICKTVSNDQKDALTKIFSGKVGGFFGVAANLIEEVLGVKFVPIEFSIEAKRRRIKIPTTTTLELEVEGMTGSNANKELVLVNLAFTVAPGYDPVIAHSTKYTYNDHGLEWDNTGRNAFYSRFTYTP